MKPILKITSITLVLGILIFLGSKVYQTIQYKLDIEEALQEMPEFSCKIANGKGFYSSEIKKGKPTVFIYFNSECDYCQHEAKSVQENIQKFQDIQLFFISSEPEQVIVDFSKKHKLNEYEFITFLSDTQNNFAKKFDVTSIPYVLIYDNDQKLIKRHKGQLNSETIIKIITPEHSVSML